MPRIRELGFYDSTLPPGPRNAISDVGAGDGAGVQVGHYTLNSGAAETGPAWRPGSGPFRTGVTIILPHGGNLYEQKVVAAVHVINGFGKAIGLEQVRELGQIETPIALTGTLNAPRVADALITLALEQSPHIGVGFVESGWAGYASVNPVVGETNDGYLSDLPGRPVGLGEVRAALAAASTEVGEGAVGAGAGTSCFGWKGGIGTASRVLPAAAGGYTVGALVQTNFGRPEELVVCGVAVGRQLRPPVANKGRQTIDDRPRPEDQQPSVVRRSSSAEQGGSIMIILATDAPLETRGLERLARRATLGLARTGSTGHGGSGDFVIAFSTANRILDRPAVTPTPRLVIDEQPLMSWFAVAVIESVEEAIYNSLLMAHTVVGRNGHTRHALPAAEVARLVRERRKESPDFRDYTG
jgi:D-aminopeptidase